LLMVALAIGARGGGAGGAAGAVRFAAAENC
jgi:hypothetical protein